MALVAQQCLLGFQRLRLLLADGLSREATGQDIDDDSKERKTLQDRVYIYYVIACQI